MPHSLRVWLVFVFERFAHGTPSYFLEMYRIVWSSSLPTRRNGHCFLPWPQLPPTCAGGCDFCAVEAVRKKPSPLCRLFAHFLFCSLFPFRRRSFRLPVDAAVALALSNVFPILREIKVGALMTVVIPAADREAREQMQNNFIVRVHRFSFR